jgi:hypothetical protein
VLGTNEFVLNYSTNKVTLGRVLASGERLRLDYSVIQPESIADDGECSKPPKGLDPLFFDRKDKEGKLTFVRGESIETYLTRNLPAAGGRYLVTGTKSEGHIEFEIDTSAPAGSKRREIMDRRLSAATAQFIAAGSFGLLHTTIRPWLGGSAAILNNAFNLNDRCLTDLSNPANPNREFDAMYLGTAFHTRTLGAPLAAPCTGRCNQITWARQWAKVIEAYNANDKTDAYPVRSTGINGVVEKGMKDFYAR